MKNHLLLPGKYKVYGWVIFLVFVLLHVFANVLYPELGSKLPLSFQKDGPESFFDPDSNMTFSGAGILLGLVLICFASEKQEDEYISYLRLRSWQLSVLISYGILFAANLLVYGGAFFSFMIYNLLTVLIVFIITFNLSLYKLKRERLADEK
ncbi:hypothetical protein [Pedobacter africanus]|uniref:DUF1648 domain-containing protein n=1 Tax=Pedobacter africanus TaxID=151894 RepID=A0A1W2AVU2_9SPHI|nr:hypothetical protein [Pedobacter africanus]SMC64571.1 hypothetical protein SAMN04488524_1688 [Pedobacter africanus]